ncbi:hypothetical protein ANOM_008526 [Aspergillus nomiae NRRL 13137]|uniref:Uncharacterized protein n=1 Tax=Aspergillus nomiae NRRL (strain ATCC 15546 / NRRL 13137 / CBS 260.88 / M93) TaxID=1509407 RepID=A0A0L1IUL9_ASPN3|nr:uncharacterized protein ANOM_008526 [Aspergillus nomiae NRRL 13137]KNG82868.1 hypothetical protein ANOM_008526 [Aspergillus nomiae NRRL 13137]
MKPYPWNKACPDEEQEWEVDVDVEREQQVQRSLKIKPKKHIIHRDMKKYISTEGIAAGSIAFLLAVQSLDRTRAARHLRVLQFPGKLLVTRDFAQTVVPIDILSLSADVFQRPVQWVLTTRHRSNSTDQKPTARQMVVISPYEAQEFYNSIKKSKHVILHLYAPRSNVGIKPLGKLDLYNVSGELRRADQD